MSDKINKKIQAEHNTKSAVMQRFNALDADKGPIISKAERYARWTLPNILNTTKVRPDRTEHQHDFQSIGARAVNHLANKLAFALFHPGRPFFRLEATHEYMQKLSEKTGVGETELQAVFGKIERAGMRRFTKWRSRTSAIFALKSIIITGNSLLYFPDGGKAQAFNFRDFVIKRDLSGKPLEIITRDSKKIETLDEDIKLQVLSNPDRLRKPDEDADLFTKIVWNHETQKYHILQAVDDFPLSTVNGSYKNEELPWIPLTWDLQRGADYGVGLVEEYAGDFHALSSLTASIIVGATIAADIKFLVDPAGNTDYKMLNDSDNGSYIPGRKEDIHTFTTEKQNDWSFVDSMINQYERRIGLAFLIGSAVTREAERVTAEEIRFQAQELETGLGGQYSRLAEEFQVPMAYILLKDIDFSIQGKEIEPIIITGLESLSRNSDVEKMLLFLQDLANISNLPEPVLRRLQVDKIIAIFGTARSVDYQEFMKSEEQVQQEMEQERQQLLEMQQQGAPQEPAGPAPAQQQV